MTMYLQPRAYGSGLPPAAPRWPSPALDRSAISWRWPDAGKVRMRKLLSRGAMRPIYRFPSLKLQRDVQMESDLERQMAMLFDACPAVASFAEQPAELVLTHGHWSGRHIPDFAVVHRGRPGFIEAKYYKDVDAEVLARTRSMAAALAGAGIGYHLVTERDLPCQARLDNARILLQRGRLPRNPVDAFLVLCRVQDGTAMTLGDLGWTLPGRSHALARDILEGRLHVDLSLRLTATTPVVSGPHAEGWLWA